jgi:ribosome-binding protein aMBF1 (putative translation factor)
MTRWCNRERVAQAIVEQKLDTCDHCSTPIRPAGHAPSHDARRGQTQRSGQNHTEQLMHIGDSIATRRQALGLSQRGLADKLRINQQVISQLEAGTRNVTLRTLLQITAELGLDITPIPWHLSPSRRELARRVSAEQHS